MHLITIATNGITLIPLVSIVDMHLITETRIIRLASDWVRWERILLVHWYDWYQRNTFIPLVFHR